MNDFYITLPSNVKNDFYDNTVANYKTKLATNIKLDDRWRVGLASISYTNSWSVEADYATFEFIYYKFYDFTVYKDDSFKLDLSEYTNVEDIIIDMNKIIKNYETIEKPFPRFQINTMTNKVEIKPTFHDNAIVFPRMSENLCKVLGFNHYVIDNHINKKQRQYMAEWESLSFREQFERIQGWKPKEPDISDYTYMSETPYNILPSFSTLYLYCDLVKHNFVGDSYTQLMRIIEVPTDSKFRDQISFNYSNIHYMPLQLVEFDTIEIHIKDDLGQTVPFLFGRTIVSLHFKRL